MREKPGSVRLVFLGSAGVGKSALIHRVLHNRFEHTYTRTVEQLHVLDCDGGTLRVEILDTSGSFSFPAMRELYIRRGDAFALVYAVDDPGSLDEVRRLREDILRLRSDSAPVAVVGNKAELTVNGGRALHAADVARTVEDEWAASFIEASARTGDNAEEVLRVLLQQVDLPRPVRRRRDTVPRAASKRRPPLKKNNSCTMS
ncbi:ras-related protein Rap-1b-like [Thalassophryne amazonica]|uniref:ras-related protein Rap-1b-like n=1 Tax=Thalassophryne amazonica TaxID=390379 RepID=UPI001470E670|nr:ras-related protein Rap-1b-like [Thalassophryne amazonica]